MYYSLYNKQQARTGVWNYGLPVDSLSFIFLIARWVLPVFGVGGYDRPYTAVVYSLCDEEVFIQYVRRRFFSLSKPSMRDARVVCNM